MIPFSRSVKWIENASQAFYESYGWIEESVLKAYSWTVWSSYNKVFSVAQDYEYSFVWSWDEIPAPGQGNAPDNPNYSRLSQNEPISILVGWKNYDNPGASISINFRIPNSVWFSSSLEDEWHDELLIYY